MAISALNNQVIAPFAQRIIFVLKVLKLRFNALQALSVVSHKAYVVCVLKAIIVRWKHCCRLFVLRGTGLRLSQVCARNVLQAQPVSKGLVRQFSVKLEHIWRKD